MPKSVKGNSERTPPEPSTAHTDVDQWLARQMPDLQQILTGLDELIRESVDDLVFAVKFKRVFYGVPGLGWIIELAPYDVSVNVLFFGGVDLVPPPPLGTVDRTRYVKLRALGEPEKSDVRGWVEQAGHTPGWT